MTKNNKITSEKGFTIVEVLLALSVFSFILIIITASYTQLLKSYRAGIATQNTQNAVRSVVDKLSEDIHRSNKLEVNTSGSGIIYLCLDNIQYSYKPLSTLPSNQPVTQSNLLRHKSASGDQCSLPSGSADGATSSDFLIVNFEPKLISRNSIKYGIDLDISVATNIPDLLDGEICDPTQSGSQFCSVSSLQTSIGLGQQ